MTDTVTLISRSPRPFLMWMADDNRMFRIVKGTNEVPQDFLDKWAERYWDLAVLDLLQWPEKPATKRAGGHESGVRGF